jgi:rubrerythrin
MDQHPTMSDLDFLIDYEKDSRIASVAYLTSACEAHDPELKEVFLDFSKGSVKHQEKFMEMIKKIGGEV